MKHHILCFIALLSFQGNAQEDEKKAVQKAVAQFFEGFHTKDSVMMQEVVHKDVILQTTYTNKKGEAILRHDDAKGFISAVINRPKEQEWKEKILSYNIQVDGTMANAWTPYEFWLNGKFLHCGVNSFQLFKKDGKWKIIYLIDTRRRSDCDVKK